MMIQMIDVVRLMIRNDQMSFYVVLMNHICLMIGIYQKMGDAQIYIHQMMGSVQSEIVRSDQMSFCVVLMIRICLKIGIYQKKMGDALLMQRTCQRSCVER